MCFIKNAEDNRVIYFILTSSTQKETSVFFSSLVCYLGEAKGMNLIMNNKYLYKPRKCNFSDKKVCFSNNVVINACDDYVYRHLIHNKNFLAEGWLFNDKSSYV